MGALSVTWDEHYREPVPAAGARRHASSPTDDPSALDRLVTDQTAAIIVEPIQGEGGVRPISPALAKAIDKACARTGALFIADEVQCGIGRTGEMFHFPALGLTPGSGVGRQGARRRLPDRRGARRRHASPRRSPPAITARPTAATCSPAAPRCTVLDTLEGGLLDHVAAVGPVLERGLRAMVARLGIDAEVRGKGLMRGVDLDRDAGAVVPAALERGLIVNRTAESVVRLLPPYVITEAEIAEASRLEAALADVLGGAHV